jgi:hypothetical protein
VACFCEYGNEYLGSIEVEFLGQLSECESFMDSAPWS